MAQSSTSDDSVDFTGRYGPGVGPERSTPKKESEPKPEREPQSDKKKPRDHTPGDHGSASTGSESKPAEKTKEQKDADAAAAIDAKVKAYKDLLSAGAGKISEELKKGADKTTAAGDKYSKDVDDLIKKTQGLSKWHEGLVTSYEGIANRYRQAFEEVEKQRVQEQQTAQRDYGANAALMSKAAAVGMGVAGPMTGAQQQLMMASSQQQATNAYAAAQDRIASMEMQRKQLMGDVVTNSMSQELQNRQAGFSMGAGMIQAEFGMRGQQYGAALTGIDAQTNAAIYGPQAQMGIENAGMQYGMGMQSMEDARALGVAQVNAMNNMPGVEGPSAVGTGIMRGLAGAGTGFAVGGPVGAGVGAVLGFGSAFFG